MRQLDPGFWGENPSVVLSVVVTNYNYGKLLHRCIASVLSQLDAHSELIIVDDGSTDNSVELLENLNVGSFQVGYIHQANAGPATARNNGLKWCRGRWVLFLDADDSLEENALRQVIAFLHNEPLTDLLLAGHFSEDPDGRRKYHSPSVLESDVSARLLDYLLRKKVSISHGCSVFRCADVRARPYPEFLRQGEDIAVFAYMLSRPHCARLDVPLATIHKHSDSLRNDVELTVLNNVLIADEVFSRMPKSIQPYIAEYKAKRALSAFRTCYRAKRRKEAIEYYRTALKLAPRQALRWDYLSKWLRLILAR